MSLVIDNSVALAWVLPDERSKIADDILDHVIAHGAYVPFIFPAEFSNALTMAVRRGRIDKAERAIAFDRVMNRLNISRDDEGSTQMTIAIDLADLHQLSVYDALYLELARRIGCPIATLDRKLARAASDAAIALAVP